jgi:2,3-bisphosphoglycerate-independent phosphoglycerate mutase
MTEYDVKLDCPVAFPSEQMQHLLGEVISEAGLKQLRLTETEKYAHVTFFFNGGQETAYDNEERALIPSPKVSTYDKEPGMSAAAITDELIRVIKAKQHDFIVVNYANADMVGHTGDFEATVQAIEDLDSLFGRIVEACGEYGGELLITADHGNAEKMRDPQTEQAHTAHTSALVPLIYFGRQAHMTKDNGSLIDIAPTVLKLLNLNIPQEMSGTPLVELEGQ